ncbi:cold-shock protein [Lysinibacillus capsici]|uniref:cold-shock protein n=1 Tax=Lysinibacillus capsici TaxID=2115968 RepID=UPI0034E2C40D
MKGRVTKIFQDKGYGFIKDEVGESRFFHVSNIKGFDELFEGSVVTFNPSQNTKGLQATEIMVLNTNNKAFISFGSTNVRLNNIKNFGLTHTTETEVTTEIKEHSTGNKVINRTFGFLEILEGVILGNGNTVDSGVRSFNDSYSVDHTKEITRKILYVTTYQGDNFRFQENLVDFDIMKKYNELNDYLSL